MSNAEHLRSVSLVAALGSLLERGDRAKQNTWKKRFLLMAKGIEFPEDFDTLPEDEKQKRLDAAIKVGLGND